MKESPAKILPILQQAAPVIPLINQEEKQFLALMANMFLQTKTPTNEKGNRLRPDKHQ